MRPLSPPELLRVWESGLDEVSVQRALRLLIAASPESAADDVARLSVGRRDAGLLSLREALFGRDLTAASACPRCGEQLELEFATDEIRAPGPENPPAAIQLNAEGFQFELRLPNSLDVIATSRSSDTREAEQILLDRCILSALHEGEAVTTADLPQPIVERIATSLAEIDPQADVELDLSCESCGQEWRTVFDIASYLWREIDVWAQRMLRDIHVLASTYGWREQDILALSPTRRQFYLDVIGR